MGSREVVKIGWAVSMQKRKQMKKGATESVNLVTNKPS